MHRPQGTDDWLILDTVAGGGLIGSDFAVRQGDIVLLRPGLRHDYRTDPTVGMWELAWAHVLVREEWMDLLEWPEPQPGLMLLQSEGQAHDDITACLDAADAAARSGAVQRDRLACNAIERALLLLTQINPLTPGGRIDPRLRAAMDRALADLRRPLSVPALARIAGLSPSRFAHRFREQVGDSPARWFERERMRQAAALLDATSRPIMAISAEVGFTDPFYFSQRFKRWAGMGPRAWRRR